MFTLQKTIVLVSIMCLLTLNAQEDNRLKVRLDAGVPVGVTSENLGLLLSVEPKIGVSNSMVIGLKFGVALNAQEFENNNTTPFDVDAENDNAIISFVPTIDYYWNENHARPYVGLGVGYFSLSQVSLANTTDEVQEGSTKNRIGFLLRGGIDVGKTRFGLEYNIIPKTDIQLPNEQILGTIDSTYLGLTIGFTI
ncbi:hypothetical protein ACOKFD_12540 [Flagellimonas sp. S174]|uniref:hypothetical protein n=1 Tax=Flagellimonas sp. S174 TaxID=3410790 RepID=UPI003BF5B9BA